MLLSDLVEEPNETSLRMRGLPHYYLCTKIFANLIIIGSLARSSTMDSWDSDEDTDFDSSHRGTNMGLTTNVRSPFIGNMDT